ncbi:hypothetical protein D3C80_912800 [compost metagenome]
MDGVRYRQRTIPGVDVVDGLERPQRVAVVTVVGPVVTGPEVGLMLAGQQFERARSRQVERGLPGLAGPTPRPGADATAIGLDGAAGRGGKGVVIAATAVFGIQFQLPAVVQLMLQRSEYRLGATLVIAPVRSRVERTGGAEVTAI